MSRPVMIMAGGTGGHIFPALAVARALDAEGVPVVWLGSRGGMETRIVPEQGIPAEWISIRGLRGKGLRGWIVAPWRILYAVSQALGALRRHQPRAVLGMGGFAAGPGGVAAWLRRTPLIIHEQNSVAGLTNRLLARLARCVLTGFPGVLPGAHVVGNPVRDEILQLPAPAERWAGREGPLRLLVVGGSLGARVFNETLPEALARLPREDRPEVCHQAGERGLQEAVDAYRRAGVEAEVRAFIGDMAAAYAWADLVICRAGALTVAELAAAGLPAILVPYPHAVDDHQTGNARYLAEGGAGWLLPQTEFVPERLADLLAGMERAELLQRAERARALAQPQATTEVARACLDAAEGRDCLKEVRS
ncbi:MAG: undecaprenyldiphospho-muramoylpentapeptide beta-N-acetylglucosaminyltransferase [Gammaproteobacteria bacterium]|nr:MAG: undecaprenyldiphospho-muramoylpentapeptide beta-N-acetylglucosaminyltransferase [Gammaproteobacteria bacterium]